MGRHNHRLQLVPLTPQDSWNNGSPRQVGVSPGTVKDDDKRCQGLCHQSGRMGAKSLEEDE